MVGVRARGSTFVPREAPDAAGYVGRSISTAPYRYVARVRYHCPKEVVAGHFSPRSATVEADGPDSCVVTAGTDDPEVLTLYLAMVGREFEILEPPEVVAGARTMAARLARAAEQG
jgi:predicted DNA-binding transcriptional regulator YafY